MQSRQRIPTIFSIYMVDVLCCALGCVVLLWQVYYQDAEEQTAAAISATAAAKSALDDLQIAKLEIKDRDESIAQRDKDLDEKKKTVVRLTIELDVLTKDRDKKLELALVTQKHYDAAKKAEAQLKAFLDAKLLELTDLAKINTDLTKKSVSSAAELAEQLRQNLNLNQKIKQAQKELANLEKDLLARKSEVDAAALKLEDQKVLLALTDAGKRKLETLLEQMRSQGKVQLARYNETAIRSGILENDLDRTRKDLLAISKQYQELLQAHALLSTRLTDRGKELEITKDMATKLKEERLFLLNQAANIRKVVESRFAGIALTGNRVVFLVDMSGSMELVDENTVDPDKWPLVAETVGKLMHSLPDLRQYQVVLFSDKTRYVLGTPGQWITFDPQKSVKETVQAIRNVKPKGGTNMHEAFQEAFRYRDLGLDTVYFFSDGLPTSGEGLPADRAKLSDTQITDILGRHIRKSLKTVWNRPIPNWPNVRINTIGFFYESPEVGAFLWALAREHDGSFVGMSKP
jgi:hypothetical protein